MHWTMGNTAKGRGHPWQGCNIIFSFIVIAAPLSLHQILVESFTYCEIHEWTMTQSQTPNLMSAFHVQPKSKRKLQRKQTATWVSLKPSKAYKISAHPAGSEYTIIRTIHHTSGDDGRRIDCLNETERSWGNASRHSALWGQANTRGGSLRSSFEEHRRVISRARVLGENYFRAWWPSAQDNARPWD